MTQFSVLLAVNLLGLALIFLFVRGRIRKALEVEGLQEKLRQEIGQLVRDLNQTTDRNISLLEDAIRVLKEAVTEADRKAAVLKREAERRSSEGAVYDRLGRIRAAASSGDRPVPVGDADEPPRSPRPARPSPGPSSTPGSAPEPETAPEYAPAPRRSGPGRIASDPGSDVPQPAIPFVTFSSTPLRSKPPLKEEVLSLNRRGISSEFIAAKLGITVAEVELIVSLEEQRGLAAREGEP